MTWFARLTGFEETTYEETKSRLAMDGEMLRSLVNGQSWSAGRLELASLADLRKRALNVQSQSRLRVTSIVDDVGHLHQQSEYAGATFQVASQFNLLEMASPARTPEDGVGLYESDPTQGPACAVAAGAATIYRNYFVPVGDRVGQRADRQLDGLADLGASLAMVVGLPDTASLWEMRNGYALCNREGLTRAAGYLRKADDRDISALRTQLRVGVHSDVEVTERLSAEPQFVTQVFCSALPVSYTSIPAPVWEPFARLILDAAYEATIWAAVLNQRSRILLLTRLGGGVFGNDDAWIDSAIERALELASAHDLDIRLVSYGSEHPSFAAIARTYRS